MTPAVGTLLTLKNTQQVNVDATKILQICNLLRFKNHSSLKGHGLQK